MYVSAGLFFFLVIRLRRIFYSWAVNIIKNDSNSKWKMSFVILLTKNELLMNNM